VQSIGEILLEAREKKGINLHQAARDTKIKLDYLEKLEANEFGKLIAPTYAKSFLRIYAEYLGVDVKPLLDQFQNLHAPAKPAPAPMPVGPKPKTSLKFKTDERQQPIAPVHVKPAKRERPPQVLFPLRATLVIAIVIVMALAMIVLASRRRGSSPAPTKGAGTSVSTSPLNLTADELLKADPAQSADTLELPRPPQEKNR
jgi:cytoskeletal protein RodZ